MKSNLRNCLSFWENNLFSTRFGEQIIYYTIIKIQLSISIFLVSITLQFLIFLVISISIPM